jgi:hypothetical protein
MSRVGSRKAGIPSVRCSARSRSGEQCRNYARVGTTLCHLHRGNARQIVRKAEQRVTLAQLLQDEPRPLVEVMADAVANADAAMRDARLRLLEGEEVTVDQLDRVLELSRLAHHLSRTMLDTGIGMKLVAEQKASLQDLGGLISEVLLAVLHPLPLTPTGRKYLLARMEYQLLTIARRYGTRVLDLPDELPSEPIPPAEPILFALDLAD